MSRICELTGKKPMSGNNVSHSNARTKRKFYPNLQRKRVYVPEMNDFVEVRVSTKALRTVSKHGLFEYVKKLQKKGFDVGFDEV